MADIPVQSVRKALDLLNVLAFDDVARQGVALTELARRMGMKPNSAHNLLKTLAACGYAAQTEDGRYVAGPSLRAVGLFNSLTSAAASRAVSAAVAGLVSRLREYAVFAALVNGQRVVLGALNADQSIAVNHAALQKAILWSTPTGRVLAAFASAGELQSVLERNGQPGEAWAEAQKNMERELEAIRRHGACVVDDPRKDIVAFAVPVLVPGTRCGSPPTAGSQRVPAAGRLLGSLGCYAPRYRCPKASFKEKLAALQGAAETLARELDAAGVAPA
ncbi:MAG TPA: helix-turn-helix domain-containing protein [Candidatus Brocadiia bacterium]|nr:helix-turn-helix domain-containing protein [Candidatus Brocadiia bacterium]